MTRRRSILVVPIAALALLATGCSNLGLGELDCTAPSNEVSTSTILTVQAVPSAKYTPCLEELRLGWDSVDWFAEDGRAGIEIAESFTTFLTAVVTPSCDVSDAVPVESDEPDIERYEDVDFEPATIEIAIVPSGERPLATAYKLSADLATSQIDDRPVEYTVDNAIDEPVGQRVEQALTEVDFVWVIDEIDAEEGTVQLRSNRPDATGHGLDVDDALDEVEDAAPDVYYRGNWYFTFEGGCITYSFDANGILAETVADDAEDAIGFFRALELREGAADAGFEIG